MKRVLAISVTVFLFVFLLADFADAQCAMCRATAETASKQNTGIGEGLNSGIVYLMLVPYVLLATVAFVFFRKKIGAFFKAS